MELTDLCDDRKTDLALQEENGGFSGTIRVFRYVYSAVTRHGEPREEAIRALFWLTEATGAWLLTDLQRKRPTRVRAS